MHRNAYLCLIPGDTEPSQMLNFDRPLEINPVYGGRVDPIDLMRAVVELGARWFGTKHGSYQVNVAMNHQLEQVVGQSDRLQSSKLIPSRFSN